ncbi:MAG TPA: 3-dehydroquinate synthase [Planctomycetaceae bacterium]|nr:3-dehydroquinate synthase [Planctomycetaceae bacterium]
MTSASAPIPDSVTVPVSLGARSYEIAIVSGKLESLAAHLRQWIAAHPHFSAGSSANEKALVVTDSHIASTHAECAQRSLMQAGWTTDRVELEPGEQSKTLASTARLYDALAALKADRRTVVVAVGGGVVGDTAGFAAATYARGIPFVQVPTTLLAQVDSSVGGKVGVNHPRGKNLIGAFHQPLGVLVDTLTLTTLPERDYRSGLAEVIKYGVSLDGEFFKYLEDHVDGLNARAPDVLRHVISISCQLKAGVVEQDEQELSGLRALLNYGHTFAHAYEALLGYGKLLHGEAVAIGMVHASRLAERLRHIDSAVTQKQVRLLKAVQLPTEWPAGPLDVEAVLDRMRLDKKSMGGKLRFVLPSSIGHVALIDSVPESEVRSLLAEISEQR